MFGPVLPHIENSQESRKYPFLWLDYNDFDNLNPPPYIKKNKSGVDTSSPKKHKPK